MRLRLKILSGFIILAVMLTVAAAWSVNEIRAIGSSVNELLQDNYKSIDASKSMLEALEREDSGVLLLLLGKWEQGRGIINSANNQFLEAFEIAANNITIDDEEKYVKKIEDSYKAYKEILDKPIVGTSKEGNINWYQENVHNIFLDVKSNVNALMHLNDKTMFATASNLREQANRAVMPALIAIFSALFFSILFNYFVNFYFVNPIVKINNGIQDFLNKKKRYSVDIKSKDELTQLNTSISTLCLLSEKDEY